MNDDKCRAVFHFLKKDTYHQREVLGTPDEIPCCKGVYEVTCILLKRYAYPSWFGRHEAQLSIITREARSYIYNLHHHRLKILNQPWLPSKELQRFADCVHNGVALLQRIYGLSVLSADHVKTNV